MLSVFRRLLGRIDVAESRIDVPARKLTSRRHAYHPELIAGLREQHRELLRLFDELERAGEEGDANACRAGLDRFAEALRTHLIVENRCLYDYLSHQQHADRDVARRIDTMSTDMMHVGRILHRFLKAHSRNAFEPVQLAQLRHDLRQVGEVLAHRIHEEETVLYPLYAPPAA